MELYTFGMIVDMFAERASDIDEENGDYTRNATQEDMRAFAGV